MSNLPADGRPTDEDIVATIVVRIRRSGAMSVAGDIQDENAAIAMLDAARDSVRSYHMRQRGGLIIPAHAAGLN
jgi:hypothetical protein